VETDTLWRVRLAAEFESGEHSVAAQTALAMNELAERVRHPEFLRLAAMWDVALASLEGRFEDAEKRSEELNHWLERVGHPQAQLIHVAQTFSWRWLQGRAGEVGVAGEHHPTIVTSRVVVAEPAEGPEGAGGMEDVVVPALQYRNKSF
jgi:hypothetical protein